MVRVWRMVDVWPPTRLARHGDSSMDKTTILSIARHLADTHHDYDAFAEENDHRSKQERMEMICHLQSIAASAAHLACALLDREMK